MLQRYTWASSEVTSFINDVLSQNAKLLLHRTIGATAEAFRVEIAIQGYSFNGTKVQSHTDDVNWIIGYKYSISSLLYGGPNVPLIGFIAFVEPPAEGKQAGDIVLRAVLPNSEREIVFNVPDAGHALEKISAVELHSIAGFLQSCSDKMGAHFKEAFAAHLRSQVQDAKLDPKVLRFARS